MHFSGVCGVMDPQEVYGLMGPYQEAIDDPDYEEEFEPFRNWFEIGGRRAGIIKLKKGYKGYRNIDGYDAEDFIKQESKLKKGYCSIAKKKDIDYFYEGKKDSDAYPHTRMFFDKNGDPVFQPEELERDQINKKIIKRKNFEKDLKRYKEKLEARYESVPDDYYIVIIDYHD